MKKYLNFSRQKLLQFFFRFGFSKNSYRKEIIIFGGKIQILTIFEF